MSSVKRRKLRSSGTSSLEENCQDLANADESVRIRGTQALILSAGKDCGLSGEQWKYILHTIVDGLCSGQQSARIGHSVALTELLSIHPGKFINCSTFFPDVPTILSLLQRQRTAVGDGSRKKGQDPDLAFVLGAEAIARSRALFRDAKSIRNRQSWNDIVDAVLEMALQKPRLREECGFMLYGIIESSLLPQDLLWATSVATGLHTHNLHSTPEGIALNLALLTKYPGIPLPNTPWYGNDPLHHNNMKQLALVFRDAFSNPVVSPQDVTSPQSFCSKAPLHFVWHTIIPTLFNDHIRKSPEGLARSNLVGFREFWRSLVDKPFFSNTSQRKHHQGFLLVQRFMADCPPELIPDLISRNLLQSLIVLLESKDRHDRQAAMQVRKAILDRCRLDDGASIPILSAFVRPPDGIVDFDKRSRTKTIEQILSDTAILEPCKSVALYENLLIDLAIKDGKHPDAQRQTLTHHLVAAVRSFSRTQMMNGPTRVFIQNLLSMFVRFAYFDLQSLFTGDRSTPMSDNSHLTFRARISSCLSHISSQCDASGDFVFAVIFNIRRYQESHETSKILLSADSRLQTMLNESFSTLCNLRAQFKSSPDCASLLSPIGLLLSLSILQVYNEDLDSVALLEDLVQIISRQQPKDILQPDGATMIVEILLSLLSKPSQLFRRIVCQVFRSLTGSVDISALQPIYKILATDENLAGQAEIFEQQDAQTKFEASSATSTASETEESFEDSAMHCSRSSEASQDDVDKEELAVFDKQLAEALGASQKPFQGDDDAQSSSRGSDLDDEQMGQLDQHLESIFREREKLRRGKLDRQNAKTLIVNFKCRALDLLDIYVKQEPGNLQGISVILPVLSLIRSTSSPLLSQRGCDLIRIMATSQKKASAYCSEVTEKVLPNLHQIHEVVGENPSNAYAKACSRASLMLVKIAVEQKRETFRQAIQLYAQTQERALLDPKFEVKPSFFIDWWSWSISMKKMVNRQNG